MNHQDWKPVVLKKGKTTSQTSHRAPKSQRNLESDEPEKPKRLGMNEGKKIQQARCAKNMTQKQLAHVLNIKPAVIQEYETGKAIPNKGVLNRIYRALGMM